MIRTRVFSEIHRLKKVMIHRPGKEIDHIVPAKANELLFEDILFGERAQSEHMQLENVLNKFGVDTFDTADLLVQAMEAAPQEALDALLTKLELTEKLSVQLVEFLKSLSRPELALTLIEGVLQGEDFMSEENLFQLRPIPNLMFARDPVIVAYDKVLVSSMAEKVRQREAELMRFIFIYHPELKKTPADMVNLSELSKQGTNLTLEGGDLLVLNEETVAIAWSVRTSMVTIRLLAESLREIGVKNLIVAKLPSKISFIHLDTVFTRINHDECLIYPPLFADESIDRAAIYFFNLASKEIKETHFSSIFQILKKLKMDLRPVYCGGKGNLITQQREQWTHGANAFCIAPGVVLIYERNVQTIRELSETGYLTVSASEVLKSSFAPNLNRKTAILLEGDELCRARGGARCLTHPLVRE